MVASESSRDRTKEGEQNELWQEPSGPSFVSANSDHFLARFFFQRRNYDDTTFPFIALVKDLKVSDMESKQ